MLSSAFKESTSPAPIVLGEVTPPVLDALFSYMYGADLPHSSDAAFLCEVWEAAHRYEVADLEALARSRTRALLPGQPRAAFAVLAVARALREEQMLQAVYAQMAAHLRAVAASPLLAELCAEDVMAVLARPESADAEGALATRFAVAMRWVEADLVERGGMTDRLMGYMDLGAATPEEVEAMAARPIANESSILMRKIAVRFSEIAAERSRLERKVSALRREVRVLQAGGGCAAKGAGENAARFDAEAVPQPQAVGAGALFSGASSFTDEAQCLQQRPSGQTGARSTSGSWQPSPFGDWKQQSWGLPRSTSGISSSTYPSPMGMPFNGQWNFQYGAAGPGMPNFGDGDWRYSMGGWGNPNLW